MATASSGPHVTIIGAGAIGLAAAYYMRRRGMSVRVLDAGFAGAGCSAANAGWITPSLSSPVPSPGAATFALRSMWSPTAPVFFAPTRIPSLARWLVDFARNTQASRFKFGRNALLSLNAKTLRLYDELAADNVSFEQVPSTGIVCAFLDESLARRSHSSLQGLQQHGLTGPGPLIEGAGAREIEAGLSAEVRAAFLCPQDRAIRPETLTAGLARRLNELGVEIEENIRVTAFTTRDDRVTEAVTTSGTRRIDNLLLAAGPGTRALARQLGARLPIEVAKGYCLTVPLRRRLGRAVSCGDRKVACTPQGDSVRLAGILEFSGDNLHVDRQRVQGVLSAARSYLADIHLDPSPDDLSGVESLAVGQRTMTPSGLPLLDRLPRWRNAYVSSAHAMLGITLAAASGSAMAEYIATGDRPALLQPFAIA